MTIEEFNAIKWRLKGILLIHNTRYTTYEGEWNGITIIMQTANRTLKHGGYGKTRVAYRIGQREFKNKEELIKYLDENDRQD